MAKKGKLVFRFVVALVILFLIGLSGFSFFISHMKANFKMPASINSVSAIEVSEMTFNGSYTASGFAQSAQSGDLYFLAQGKVEKILVKPGQEVKKGDIIAQLDQKADLASIAAQKANLASLKQNYEGLRAVYASGGSSKIAVTQAKAQLDQLQATIRAAEEALANKSIKAPYDGTVGSIYKSIGDLVSSSTKIANVIPNADNAQVGKYLNVSVSPDLVDKIAVGNEVQAFDKNKNQVATGTIAAIDSSINQTTGTSEIRVTFSAEESRKIRDGQYLSLKIAANPLPNTVVIPDIAVVYTLYGETVYVLEKLTDADKEKLSQTAPVANDQKFFDAIYKVKETKIVAKDRTDGVALVTSGLTPGQIIVTNYNQISDGNYVRIAPGYGLGISEPFKLAPTTYSVTNNSTNDTNNSKNTTNK